MSAIRTDSFVENVLLETGRPAAAQQNGKQPGDGSFDEHLRIASEPDKSARSEPQYSEPRKKAEKAEETTAQDETADAKSANVADEAAGNDSRPNDEVDDQNAADDGKTQSDGQSEDDLEQNAELPPAGVIQEPQKNQPPQTSAEVPLNERPAGQSDTREAIQETAGEQPFDGKSVLKSGAVNPDGEDVEQSVSEEPKAAANEAFDIDNADEPAADDSNRVKETKVGQNDTVADTLQNAQTAGQAAAKSNGEDAGLQSQAAIEKSTATRHETSRQTPGQDADDVAKTDEAAKKSEPAAAAHKPVDAKVKAVEKTETLNATNTADSNPSDSNPLTAAHDRNELAARETSGKAAPQAMPDVESDQADRVRFVQRVARAFENAGRDGGTLRVRLHPSELGSLRLEVAVRDGAMTARLETETQAAKNVVLDNLPALRDRLEQQNIKIERFDVDYSGGNNDQPSRNAADGRQSQNQFDGRPNGSQTKNNRNVGQSENQNTSRARHINTLSQLDVVA